MNQKELAKWFNNNKEKQLSFLHPALFQIHLDFVIKEQKNKICGKRNTTDQSHPFSPWFLLFLSQAAVTVPLHRLPACCHIDGAPKQQQQQRG